MCHGHLTFTQLGVLTRVPFLFPFKYGARKITTLQLALKEDSAFCQKGKPAQREAPICPLHALTKWSWHAFVGSDCLVVGECKVVTFAPAVDGDIQMPLMPYKLHMVQLCHAPSTVLKDCSGISSLHSTEILLY